MSTSAFDFDIRLQRVRALGQAYADPLFADRLVQAYVADTAFRREDAVHREVRTPSTLCGLSLLEARTGAPSGPESPHRPRVAVAVPRNSVGLTIAKAVVGAYLAGFQVMVRLPTQLDRTAPLVERLLTDHLPGVLFAPRDMSGTGFLEAAFRDRDTDAVVVYGDDAWIDRYRPMAEHSLTRLYFEGPGKDPLIILPGTDIDMAVDAAVRGGLHNGGQSCSAFERFFVHETLHDAFVEALIDRLATLKVGGPRDEAAGVGPIASRTVLGRLLKQIEDAQGRGAVLRQGGQLIPDVHAGLPGLVPAVLTRVDPSMAVMADESFGPVFPVMAFRDDADLLPAVDACRYGLNASVYGPGAERYVPWLEARHRNVYVDATPFDAASLPTRIWDGGYRRSGFCWVREGERLVAREGRRLLSRVLAEEAG